MLARGYARVGLAALLIAEIFFSYAGTPQVVNAQGVQGPLNANTSAPISVPKYEGVDQSIADYLCVPNDGNTGTAIYECISKGYRLGIAFGGIALVFFIVFAGYMYMTGGETGKGKAKGILTAALTGMAIILSSYVLLNFINPDLVKIKPIQTPVFTASDLPRCEDVGLNENCVLSSGQVNVGSSGIPGSSSEAQYKALISKYASQNGLEYCALSALLQKESSFNKLIVSNPPPNTVNTGIGSPPSYNVTFSTGHGIGLTQVYIYPGKTSRPGGEFGMSKALTVQDLIDPDTSINAGSFFFGKLVKERKNNLREAYDDYQAGRGGNSDPATLSKYIDMYTSCKART